MDNIVAAGTITVRVTTIEDIPVYLMENRQKTIQYVLHGLDDRIDYHGRKVFMTGKVMAVVNNRIAVNVRDLMIEPKGDIKWRDIKSW